VEYERWLRSFLSTISTNESQEARDATLLDHVHKVVTSNYAQVISVMKVTTPSDVILPLCFRGHILLVGWVLPRQAPNASHHVRALLFFSQEHDRDPHDQKTGFIDENAFKQILMHEAGISVEEMVLLFKRIPQHSSMGTIQYENFVKMLVSDPYKAIHTFHEAFYRPGNTTALSHGGDYKDPLSNAMAMHGQHLYAIDADERERHTRAAIEQERRKAELAHRRMLENARREAEMVQIRAAEEEAAAAAAADAERWATMQHEMAREAAMAESHAAMAAHHQHLEMGAVHQYPASHVRRDIARSMHQHLEQRPSPQEAAKANAQAAHIPRSPEKPPPSLMLTPKDRLDSLNAFNKGSSYVNGLSVLEKHNLLDIEKEAKMLNDEVLSQIRNAPSPVPPAQPQGYGEQPSEMAEKEKRELDDKILHSIYGKNPELYGRLYGGQYMGGRLMSHDLAVHARELTGSTDVASQLDILRNTPMDMGRKLELLNEIRTKNRLTPVLMEDVIATAPHLLPSSKEERGYGSKGYRIGAENSYPVVEGASAPHRSFFSGGRPWNLTQ